MSATSAGCARLMRRSCGSRPRTASSAGARARTPRAVPADYSALVHLLNQEFGPRLIGRDASPRSRRSGRTSTTVAAPGSAAARGHALPELARRGLTIAAISAIDIALWDIRGKALEQPVWALLGGRSAERLPAYASGGWADAGRDRGAACNPTSTPAGFGAVKMRVGSMDGSPQVSAGRVQCRARGDRAGGRSDGGCARDLYGRRGEAVRGHGRGL